MKALSDSKPSVSTTSVAASGAGAIPALLDEFTVDGPNGTHPCYTAAVAECNIRDCSSLKMFKLDVARALALKLVSAVAYMHGQGYVHGGKSRLVSCFGADIKFLFSILLRYSPWKCNA